MKVLVASAKQDFGKKLDDAAAQVRAKIGTKADVVPSDKLNWNDIRTVEGGWYQAYTWAARSFDAIVLVETDDGGLGRGQFQLAESFAGAGKSVGVLRDGAIQRVADVRVSDNDNWKSYFGVVLIASAPDGDR